jgi:hypothetical protein
MAKRSTLAKAIVVACLSSITAAATAQSFAFKEDFGTPASEKSELIEEHVWSNNPSSMFKWASLLDGSSINVRSNNPSDYDGASGDGNLYFKGCMEFSIVGIVTAGYPSMKLSFGAFGKNAGDVKNMNVKYSADGAEAVTLADFADLDLNTAKKKWTKVEGLELPSCSTLDLTFTSTLSDLEADGGIRLDDILITYGNTTGITQNVGAQGGVVVNGSNIKYLGSEGQAALYDINGRKVADLLPGVTYNASSAHGVYIIKVGAQTKKVVLRKA